MAKQNPSKVHRMEKISIIFKALTSIKEAKQMFHGVINIYDKWILDFFEKFLDLYCIMMSINA